MKKGKRNRASSFFVAGAEHAFEWQREEGKNKNYIEWRKRRLLCEGKKKEDGNEQELHNAVGQHQSPVGGKTIELPCDFFFWLSGHNGVPFYESQQNGISCKTLGYNTHDPIIAGEWYFVNPVVQKKGKQDDIERSSRFIKIFFEI